MTESKPDVADSFPDTDVKSPNLIERAKEEIEAIFHAERSPVHHREHHGIDDVKAPNVLERAKEEIEAIVQTLHQKKISDTDASPKTGNPDPLLGKNGKPDKSPHHHFKETHGMSDDIDENTPINDVRGPNVFERAKEEIEALVQAIHPKKESNDHVSSPIEEGGFRLCLGRGLEKVCSPWTGKGDQ